MESNTMTRVPRIFHLFYTTQVVQESYLLHSSTFTRIVSIHNISAHMFTSMPAILLAAKNSRRVTDRYKRRKGADRSQTTINVFIENK